jgi:putative DNA primase/helicase
MREIVMKIMGPAAAPVEGSTTESGIRQYLGHDALPVIFDEAEAEDKNAMNRIEEILNLMRISSAESASKMLKGTAGHAAKSFSIRSSFLFASIIYQARKHADRTRVSVLGLAKYLGDRDAHFEELKRKYIAVMSDEFVSGFHARTITMLPTLMANIEVFTKVASEYLGSSRLADQIAPLCAGAWLLASDKVVTEELARRWMEQQDWEEERSLEGDRDELQLLSYLLECVVKVEQGEYGSTVERTIGELIDGSLSGGNNYGHVEQMKDRLLRVGIKIDAGRFIVSNTAKGVRDLLRGTQWEKNHGKVLQRIDGAECTGTIYFMSGHSSRGVAIAWKSITTG